MTRHGDAVAVSIALKMKRILQIIGAVVFMHGAAYGRQPAPEKKLTEQEVHSLQLIEPLILYHPRAYASNVVQAFTTNGGKRIDFQTSQGRQSAWVIAPTNRAEKLWVICGGNATLALELESLCRAFPFPRDAYLLVDYPGYGECAGMPSPASIRENLKTSILSAAEKLKLGTNDLPGKVCVFGHSLGCAVALLAAEEFHLRSAVLCAPFTSTFEMARLRFDIPTDFPLKHQFDNRVTLAALRAIHGHAWIFHGDTDDVIPVEMSKKLAGEFAETVKLEVLPETRHNNVMRRAGNKLVEAMREAEK